MTATTFRVHDSDFVGRSTDELISLAAAVALSYSGNWTEMVRWKEHCQQARPLEPKQARTILNMAMSDIGQSAWHPAIRGLASSNRIEQSSYQTSRPRLTVVREPPRRTRWFVDTHVKIKSGLIRPSGWSAKVHRVDQLRSHLRWEVPGERDENNDADKVPTELWVWAWCGKHYKNPTILPSPDDRPSDDEMCRGCLRTERTDGYPPSGRINFRGTSYARYWRPT